MKSVMGVVFGVSIGVTVSIVTDYSLMDWQWWAAVLPVTIIGIIYAIIPEK